MNEELPTLHSPYIQPPAVEVKVAPPVARGAGTTVAYDFLRVPPAQMEALRMRCDEQVASTDVQVFLEKGPSGTTGYTLVFSYADGVEPNEAERLAADVVRRSIVEAREFWRTFAIRADEAWRQAFA